MLNGWQHEELGMLDIKVINQRGLDKEIITADDYQIKKKKKKNCRWNSNILC